MLITANNLGNKEKGEDGDADILEKYNELTCPLN